MTDSKKTPLTTTSYAMLVLVERLGRPAPYDIKQALDKSIQNFWPVPHTTAHEEPARLAAAGYLDVTQQPGGRRRKSYSLTDQGREALVAWAVEPSAAPPQLRDELMLKVFAAADPAPLIGARSDWHRTKLAELRGYLDEDRTVDGRGPAERTQLVGVAYHELMLELLERLPRQTASQATNHRSGGD